MAKPVKIIAITTVVLLLLVGGYWGFALMAFSGTFDTTPTMARMEEEFNHHPNKYKALADYFSASLPKGQPLRVTFGLGQGWFDGPTLTVANAYGPSNLRGGLDTDIDSDSTRALLAQLGWTTQTVATLEQMLQDIGCNVVTINLDIEYAPVEVYSYQRGWCFRSYLVFAQPVNSVLAKRYSNPLATSGPGSFTVINTECAL